MPTRRYLCVVWPGGKAVLAVAPLVLAGCAADQFDDRPRTVNSRDQAAAVLVAPTMVAPWSDVSAALKPAFTMTGDTAVPLVLPVTEGIQQSQLSASAFGLGLGLPQSSTSGSAGSTSALNQNATTTGGVTTTTSTLTSGNTSNSTTTISPGVVPTLPSGIPAGGALPATVAAGALALDPVLKYKAAYYLNQTVQLLNQEIDNVARRRCFVPYVVRLKLAVMPYQPSLAYSAHAHIAFLSGDGPTGIAPDPSGVLAPECRNAVPTDGMKDEQGGDAVRNAIKEAVAQSHDSALAALNAAKAKLAAAKLTLVGDQKALQDAVNQASLAEASAAGAVAAVAQAAGPPAKKYANQFPQVVPLLAADDLDVAMRSQSAETARQLGLALNFMVHGIGGSGSANAVKQSLKAVANQDLSSALTVSRDNDNTLYVEIAAANAASGRPTLVGQTYDVAVLLLIPRSYFGGIQVGADADPTLSVHPAKIGFVTATDFRDAMTGSILPIGKASNYIDRFQKIIYPYSSKELTNFWRTLPAYTQEKLLSRALNLFQQGKYKEFFDDYFYTEDDSDTMANANCPFDKLKIGAKHQCFPSKAAPELWASLISLNDDSPNKYGLIEAPIPPPIKIPVQTVLLSDDGSSPIQAVVGNVTAQSVANLTATVTFTPNMTGDEPACAAANDEAEAAATRKGKAVLAKFKPKPCEQKTTAGTPMSIPMAIGALNPSGHTLTLTMPSLGKMNIKGFYTKPVATPDVPAAPAAKERGKHAAVAHPAPPPVAPAAVPPAGPVSAATITFTTDSCDLRRDVCATIDPASASAAASTPIEATVDAQLYVNSAPPPPLTITPANGQLVIASGGVGSLSFMIGGTLAAGDDFAYLAVTGGDVVSVMAGSTAVGTNPKLGYKLATGTAYTLNFANLTPGATVTVKVQGGAGGKFDSTAPTTGNFVAVPALPSMIKP